MSHPLIDHSLDLKRLRDEGYDVEVKAGFLLLKNVPYLDSARRVRRGTLVSELTLAGNRTTVPRDHVVDFEGEMPYDAAGLPLTKIVIGSGDRLLGAGVSVNHKFSSKPIPPSIYRDYYEKLTTYVAILSSNAQAVDPSATAQVFPVLRGETDDDVFEYVDTATSRAGIALISEKLKQARIGIVGLGGTGSYILDLVSKTPVREIHLFDGDLFFTHNAFRAPGAASLEELNQHPKKVDYFAKLYGRMRRGITPHAVYVDETNAALLSSMSFVFLAIDAGSSKMAIVSTLVDEGIPFVDVGMGITIADNALSGILRTTVSLPGKREHFAQHVSMGANEHRGEYDLNIQIAELNALNAALAVIRWKRYLGFYVDISREYHSLYTLDANVLINEADS